MTGMCTLTSPIQHFLGKCLERSERIGINNNFLKRLGDGVMIC